MKPHLQLVREPDNPMDVVAKSPEEAVYGVWFVPTVTHLELRRVHLDLNLLVLHQAYKLCCCDCGLVHRLDFRLVTYGRGLFKKIQFRVFRDNRATAAIRRWRK